MVKQIKLQWCVHLSWEDDSDLQGDDDGGRALYMSLSWESCCVWLASATNTTLIFNGSDLLCFWGSIMVNHLHTTTGYKFALEVGGSESTEPVMKQIVPFSLRPLTNCALWTLEQIVCHMWPGHICSTTPLLFRGLEDCDQGGEHKENVNIASHQVNKTDL